ncbi:MAG: hypothetical protein V3R94_01445 [Acidobacteriota bacterium]
MEESSYKSSAWYPILAVGISMIGFISIKIGRDAVFFGGGGLRQLPLVYMLMAAVSVPAAMVHLEAIKKWGARKVRTSVFLLTAAMFLCFVPFVDVGHKILVFALFVLVPAAFAALFAGAWLLAGDLMEGADEKVVRWVYSRIGAGSMVGGIIGGLVAGGLSMYLSPRYLIVEGVVMILVAAGIISRAHRKHPIGSRSHDTAGASEMELDREVEVSTNIVEQIPATLGLMKEPYILGLIGISAVSAVAALYIDFQFYAIVTLSGHVDAQFFAGFYTMLNLAALVLQLVAAPWIQARYGVGGALMVLPIALLGGLAGLVMVSATVVGRAVLKVTEGGLKSSIHRSIWEQVFLPLGSGRRAMAKVMVDGLFARISEGIAAVALYIWLLSVPNLEADLKLSWVTWVILVSVLLWILLTRYLSKRGCSEIEERDAVIRLPDS